MCNRYAIRSNQEAWLEHYGAQNASVEMAKSKAVFPKQTGLICRPTDNGNRELAALRWGYRPHWAKDGPTPNNARVEKVFASNYYKAGIRHQRCLVPVNWWNEWTGPKGSKTMWALRPQGIELFSFAGFWGSYEQDGEQIAGYTVITGPASESITHIHNRQPLVITPGDYDDWLDCEQFDQNDLSAMLQDQPGEYEVVDVGAHSGFRLSVDEPGQ